MTNAAEQIHEHLGVKDAAFRKQLDGGSWQEVINLENTISNQIANCADLAQMARTTVLEAGTMNAEFDTLSTGALRYLHSFSSRYAALVRRRDGRSKQTQNSTEYTDYMTIGLELTSLTEEMQVVVVPLLFTISEAHNNALNIIRDREAKALAEETEAEAADPVQPTVEV